jgi:hypothetical protein
MRRQLTGIRACVFKTAMACVPLLFAAVVPMNVALANISPAATYTPTEAFNNVESYSLGWSFTVNAPIWVSALGYYDYSAGPTLPYVFCCAGAPVTSGLTDNHIVGIFNSTGTLLTSTTVPAGMAGTLVGNSLYSSVPTIELTPGKYYVEGTQQGSAGANPTDPVAFEFSSFTTLPEITVGEGVYNATGGPDVLTFAGSGCCGYKAYVGPNFLASDTAPSATPEPDFRLLLVAGLAGLLIFWKRRTNARSEAQ